MVCAADGEERRGMDDEVEEGEGGGRERLLRDCGFNCVEGARDDERSMV